MPTNPVVSPLLLDLLGVFAFGLSGGLVGVRKRLDLFGVLVLAGATALGGGILRDLLIGAIPPVGISDWRLVAAALTAGLVTFVYHPGVERLARLVKVLDAVGLAVFAVGGALIALAMPGIPPLAAIIVGTLTAVGGGVLRDVLAGQVPEVLRRELYALPALLGATIVVVAYEVGFISPFVVWGAAALVFGIRIVAVVLNLNAPQPFRLGEPR
jgi:uncharacterized membrane protein YeiH